MMGEKDGVARADTLKDIFVFFGKDKNHHPKNTFFAEKKTKIRTFVDTKSMQKI
jgi:hypothetical protein